MSTQRGMSWTLGVVLALIALLAACAQPTATPTAKPKPAATATTKPAATATVVPTATTAPKPTSTSVPPTATSVPPTATTVPPTATSTAVPTATSTPKPPTPTPQPATVSSTIADFTLEKLTIRVGDTVVWTNKGVLTHTSTSGTPAAGPSGLWDSLYLSPGKSFSFTFTKAGTFDYYCRIHGSQMTGSVTVTQ